MVGVGRITILFERGLTRGIELRAALEVTARVDLTNRLRYRDTNNDGQTTRRFTLVPVQTSNRAF